MLHVAFFHSAAVSCSLALTFTAAALAQSPSSSPATPAPGAAAASIAPKIEDQASFIVVGITVRTNNAAEQGQQGKIPALWQGAMQNGTLDQIPNKVGDSLVVVYSDYASDHNGDYNYTLGYKVTAVDKIPDGMVARTIPAGKYAVFTSEQGAPQDVIPALWQHINSLSPQQLDRAYKADFETYPDLTDWNNMRMTAHIGLK